MDRIARWRSGISDRRTPEREIGRGSTVCLPSFPLRRASRPATALSATTLSSQAGRLPPATTMHRSGTPEAVGVHHASEDSDELREQLQRAVFPRYRIEGEIGHGGMAFVFRGWDTTELRAVAFKVLKTNTLPCSVPRGSCARSDC